MEQQHNEEIIEFNYFESEHNSNLQIGETIEFVNCETAMNVIPAPSNILHGNSNEPQTSTSSASNYAECENNILLESMECLKDTEECNDLKILLKSWNAEDLYNRLTNVGVGVLELKHIETDEINQIFGPLELGKKIMFKYYLNTWRKGSNTSEVAFTIPPSLIQPGSSVHSVTYTSIANLLSQNECGKTITEFYENNKLLEPIHRDMICTILVNYYIRKRRAKLSTKEIKNLADEIVLCFPTECLNTYFTHRGSKRCPTGKLYNKFDYEHRKLNKYFLKRNENNSEETPTNEVSGNICNDEYILIKTELKNLRSPRDLVMQKWKQTTNLRIQELMNNQDQSICNILSDWPIYKHPFMSDLIDIDFNTMYSAPSNLYSNWDSFINVIPEILKCHFKQPEHISALEELVNNKHNINLDSYNIQILNLLIHIIPPSVKNKNKNAKKVAYSKPTLKDCQTWFVNLIESVEEIPKELERVKNICKKENIELQPLLLAIGNKMETKEFIIVLDEIKFIYGSFLEALDKLFKIYQVFQLEYPKPSYNVWLFIQQFLYKVCTKYDEKVPNILTLINDLNNRLKIIGENGTSK